MAKSSEAKLFKLEKRLAAQSANARTRRANEKTQTIGAKARARLAENLTGARVAMAVVQVAAIPVGMAMGHLHRYAEDEDFDLEVGETGLGWIGLGAVGLGLGTLMLAKNPYIITGTGLLAETASADTGILTYRRASA